MKRGSLWALAGQSLSDWHWKGCYFIWGTVYRLIPHAALDSLGGIGQRWSLLLGHLLAVLELKVVYLCPAGSTPLDPRGGSWAPAWLCGVRGWSPTPLDLFWPSWSSVSTCRRGQGSALSPSLIPRPPDFPPISQDG